MSLLRGLSLRQLRALSATSRTGSVTAAAKAMHVTPPAVSTQLRLLEEMVGGAVLLRTAAGFEPTELGRELIRMAEEVDSLIGQGEERLLALRAGLDGAITLGVVSTGKYVVPRLVAAFQRARPRIRVRLLIGNRSDIIHGLERRDFDLLIMGRPPTHVDVVSEVLGDHPYVLIAPPQHRLAGKPKVLPDDIARETFLAREEGSGTRLVMTRFLERMGNGRPFDVVEMGTNETIKQAVMAGLGIAIISAHTCHTELAEGKLVSLSATGLPLVSQWFLLHRRDRPLSPVSDAFRMFILANKATMFPGTPPRPTKQTAHDR